MRYKIKLSFDGLPFSGWQIQPNAVTVQGVLQETISKICRAPIKLVGCGRTDAGVHALQYFAHFDFASDLPSEFQRKINANLPDQISLLDIEETHSDWHARYSAVRRKYVYFISDHIDPLNQGKSFHFHRYRSIDRGLLNEAATLIKTYQSFEPFCKSHSDATHYLCDVTEAFWLFESDQIIFVISANRFLRGMVRLIVGMCLNVALSKMSLADVRLSLDDQTSLPMPWSVPAEGLFLADIIYPVTSPTKEVS